MMAVFLDNHYGLDSMWAIPVRVGHHPRRRVLRFEYALFDAKRYYQLSRTSYEEGAIDSQLLLASFLSGESHNPAQTIGEFTTHKEVNRLVGRFRAAQELLVGAVGLMDLAKAYVFCTKLCDAGGTASVEKRVMRFNNEQGASLARVIGWVRVHAGSISLSGDFYSPDFFTKHTKRRVPDGIDAKTYGRNALRGREDARSNKVVPHRAHT